MQSFMGIPRKNRSWSQQVRDEQEAKDRREAKEAMDRRGNIESALQQEEQARAAKQRRETQLKNITAQDLASMSPADVAKAYDDGLLAHLTAPAPAGSDSSRKDSEPNDDLEQEAEIDEPAGSVTPEELAGMTPAEIVKAYDAGRFNAPGND